MRFGLTEEQTLLRASVERFVERELTPAFVRAADSSARPLHTELLLRMAAMGFTGVTIPVQYGGCGGGAIEAALIAEGLARASLSAAVIYCSAIGFGCQAVLRAGQPAQREATLPAILRGEATFVATLPEPGTEFGPDIVSLQATRASDGFRLHGGGMYALGATQCSALVVAARRAGEKESAPQVGLFLIPPRTKGIRLRPIESIGLRGAGPLCEVTMDDAHAPDEWLLGELGAGWPLLESALAFEHVVHAAACIGGAQQVIEDAIRHAGERRQFGQPIGKFQAISHLLVDLQVQVDAARTLVEQAAWSLDAHRDPTGAVAMARLAAAEALLETTSQAMRVYGGYGLTLEFDVQRPFRDARWFLTGAGASRIQRDRIAHALGLPS